LDQCNGRLKPSRLRIANEIPATCVRIVSLSNARESVLLFLSWSPGSSQEGTPLAFLYLEGFSSGYKSLGPFKLLKLRCGLDDISLGKNSGELRWIKFVLIAFIYVYLHHGI